MDLKCIQVDHPVPELKPRNPTINELQRKSLSEQLLLLYDWFTCSESHMVAGTLVADLSNSSDVMLYIICLSSLHVVWTVKCIGLMSRCPGVITGVSL